MKTINFSQRLSGVAAILIYLGLVVGFAPTGIRHHQLDGTAHGTQLMTALIFAFGISVTFGWRWCIRRKSPQLVYAYFVGLSLLSILMFVLENVDTRTGAGVGNLFAVLLLQAGVLPVIPKLAIYFSQVGMMIVVSALLLPFDRVLLPSFLVFLTNGAITLIGHLIVRDEQTQQALEAANLKLTEYAKQIEALATARERNRLAREIHDSLGHYLTVVNMQIEAALAVMDADSDRARQSMTKAQTLTKNGLTEIRRSVAALRDDTITERPLHEALLQLVEEHRSTGLEVHYRLEGAIRPCPAQIEMTLYRAAQEGLTNIRKHAKATRAELHLNYQRSDAVALELRDNGVGGAEIERNGGFGLLGLFERAKLLGGAVKVQSAPGEGVMLCVELPT